jgi:tetratricopeptide (TPR) repeat protein
VIHRDINPANVLINQRDEPVLVDFGIAKLLSTAEPGKTLQAFTPEYAAPEQVQGASITTATDVYGLGCLLKRLLGDLLVDRDLHLVAQVAMHTDPQSRYASASELADDLAAWLQQRPIRARPDSLAYRLRKFSARNRNSMILAGLAVLIAMVGVISTTWQSRQGQIESEKHQAIADFMLQMFQQADLMQSGADLRVTELLQAAADQAGDALEQSPDSLVALLSLIASGQTELTSYTAAEAALARAETLIDQNRISVATEAEFLGQRARLAYELGDHPAALEFADQSMKLLQNAANLSKRYFAAAAQAISYRVDTYEYADALRLAEQVYAKLNEADSDAESRALITHRYAIALEVNEQFDAAFQQYDLALQLQADHQPQNVLGRASILSDYGIALYFAGQYEKSEQVQKEALQAYGSQFSPPHPRLSSTLQNISMALAAQDDLDEAIDLLQQSIAMSIELHGSRHVDTLQTQMGLGTLLTRNQQFPEAEQLLLETLETLEQDFPDTHVQLGIVNSYLAEVYFQSGRWEESKQRNLAALELFGELPADHVRVLATQKQLADINQQLKLTQPQ